MELVCRGSDVRALKGFIAAALSGKELTFVPMVKSNEGYGGSQVVLDPKGIALSDANAIARYLGGGVPSSSSRISVAAIGAGAGARAGCRNRLAYEPVGHVTFVGESDRLRARFMSAPNASSLALRFKTRTIVEGSCGVRRGA